MPRKKPYTRNMMILDIVLGLVTGFLWWMIIPFRELYYFFGPK